MRKIVAQIEFEVEEIAGLTDSESVATAYVSELLPELISALSDKLSSENYKGPDIRLNIVEGSVQQLDN
jgi:hypothetical protein